MAKSKNHTNHNQNKKAHKNGTTLKEEALKTGLINEKEFMQIVDPKKMVKPS